MLIPDSTRVERLDKQRVRLQWQARPSSPINIALDHAPEHLLDSSAAGELEIVLEAGPARPVFLLRDQQGGRVRAAERRLALSGTPNFRDFGGYFTRDGRQVRWGKLYRSGQLATLTDTDVQLLGELELALVCDFRRDEERDREPSRLPASARVLGLSIAPGSTGSFYDEMLRGDLSPDRTGEFMMEINREFALHQREPYRQMFEQLLDVDAPLLVHCAAGKDRTGFAAALILASLDVPRERILADYLLTADYLCPDRETLRLQKKYGFSGNEVGLRPMLEVREAYLEAAFAVIDAEYDSMDAYLERYLGIGDTMRKALRQRLLYSAD